MKKVHFEMKNKLSLFFISFQNINMYSKGTYLFKIQGDVAHQKCLIYQPSSQTLVNNLLQKDPTDQFTKNFMIKYQNQKVDVNQLFDIYTPLYKYSKDSHISLKISLFKADHQQGKEKHQYTKVASTTMIIRFTLNSIFEYCECVFQQPFLSCLSILVFAQPSKVVIETKSYKHSSQEEILSLKKQVKRLRYNNYLMQNKFKKFIYNQVQYQFTLPKMFVSGENDMTQVVSSQQKFLDYLILYEKTSLTPELLNYQLTSIVQKNQNLHQTFKKSSTNGIIFINKLRMQWQQKQSKKYKQYISKQEHKAKFCEEYKAILKQKLKLLQKQSQVINREETLNNILMKYDKNQPNSIPVYPIVIHQMQKIKVGQKHPQQTDKQSKKKVRYIFILAHGYQGCPNDLIYIANGIKRKYRRSKYLILDSYQNKMDYSLIQICKLALQQTNNYLQLFNFKDKEYRIVMIGHSMGGLILRYIAAYISHPGYLYGFVSLGTPHLGYLQGIKFLIKAGISFLSNISNNPCLNELCSKDSNNLHECLIYNLSKTAPLSKFKKVILLSSVNDKYVSWHSARLQHYNKDLLKQYNFIQKQMIENIIGNKDTIQRIDRIQIQFKSAQQSNMDKIIGRSSHIKFLNDHQFIELFINGCLHPILED